MWGILVLFFLAVFFVITLHAEERILEGRPLARRGRRATIREGPRGSRERQKG